MNSTAKRQSITSRRSSNTLKNSSNKLRSFSLLTINGKKVKEGGRYLSSTPKAAASKMFTRWCRDNKKKGQCLATVTIVETTRGHNHNEYSYNAIRREHEHTMEHKDVQILHKYVNVLYTTKNVKSKSSKKD